MELPVAWTAHPRGGYDELLLSQNNDIFSIISDISLENINNNSFYDSILNNLSYSLISNTSFDISFESQTTSFNDVNHNTTLFSIISNTTLNFSNLNDFSIVTNESTIEINELSMVSEGSLNLSNDLEESSLDSLDELTQRTLHLNNRPDLDVNNSDLLRHIHINYTMSIGKYVTLETLNNEYKSKHNTTMLYLNARSLPNKLTRLKDYVQSLSDIKMKPIFISITEIFNPDCIYLNNYTFYSYCREKKNGGGTGIFIDNTYKFTQIVTDTKPIETVFEFIVGRVELPNKKNIALVTIYHPPSSKLYTLRNQKQLFFESLSNLLDEIDLLNLNVIFAGDMNIDLLQDDNIYASQIINLFISHGHILNNRKATFFKDTTMNSPASFLDHIYTSSSGLIRWNCTLTDEFADHCNLIMDIDLEAIGSRPCFRLKNDSESRNYSTENIQKFIDKIKETNFISVLNANDPILASNLMYDLFLPVFNSCFPVKIRSNFVNRDIKNNAFMTPDLLILKKKKDRLSVKSKQNPRRFRRKYKKMRNLFNRQCELAERSLIRNKLNAANNNSKMLWSVLQNIHNPKPRKEKIGDIKDRNGNLITDDITKGKVFNNFMVNDVASEIIEKIPNFANRSFREFMNPPNANSFTLNPTSADEVYDVIKKLKPKKSADIRGMSVFLLQKIAPEMSYILAHIFNLSLQHAVFPDKFKDSVVNPFHKKGDDQDISNYRGITLGDTFGKVCEKWMSIHLVKFLADNNVICKYQFGFLKNFNTHHCLTSIQEKIVDALNNKKFVACVGLDVQKAFDLVDHQILFEKLENIGIRGQMLNFFISYYSNRRQYVRINGKTSSDYLIIPRSVLQGTILGVIGFLIFINDLPNATRHAFNKIFADDLNSIFIANSHDELLQQVNSDIERLFVYYSTNKLSIHPQKSTVILFNNKNRKNIYNTKLENGKQIIDFDCRLNGNKIRIANNSKEDGGCVKILGIFLDERLTFQYQANTLLKKLSSACYALRLSKKYLEKGELLLLFNAFFKSHINYSIPYLSACSASTINDIQKVEKKAIRIVENKSYREHSAPLFKQNKILPINESMTLYIATFMFKVHILSQPNAIIELWDKAIDRRRDISNTRHLRNYNEFDFNLPANINFQHLSKQQKFLFPKTFNDLDLDIKSSVTKNEFINKLKSRLLQSI